MISIFSATVVFIGTFTMASDPLYIVFPHEAKAEEATSTVPTIKHLSYPILDRIADCESGGGKKSGAHQFAKDGQPVIHPNTDGSYDIGYMQINSTHRMTAHKLGYDLFTEDGNKAFGEWLYRKNGTRDWNSSRLCWERSHYKEV